MPVVSSTASDPWSRCSSPRARGRRDARRRPRRRSDFADADARWAARSAAQASTARPAITTSRARRAGPRRDDSAPVVEEGAAATTVAMSHAWAITRSAVAPADGDGQGQEATGRAACSGAAVDRADRCAGPSPARWLVGRSVACATASTATPFFVRHRFTTARRRTRASGVARPPAAARDRTARPMLGAQSHVHDRRSVPTRPRWGARPWSSRWSPLNDELTIALLICVDMGVAFAETAGRELAELMRPARPEIVVSVATMGIPLAIEASRALGLDDYVILHKTPKIHLGESWSEPVYSITTDKPQRLRMDPARVGRGARATGWRWSMTSSRPAPRWRRPCAWSADGGRARRHGDADDRGRRMAEARWARTRLWSVRLGAMPLFHPDGPGGLVEDWDVRSSSRSTGLLDPACLRDAGSGQPDPSHAARTPGSIRLRRIGRRGGDTSRLYMGGGPARIRPELTSP